MSKNTSLEVTVAKTPEQPHWTAQNAKPIVFIIITLVGLGVYMALKIPVEVFPSTDFPRVVVGVDNGVAPIDQMLVTVTRPIEEAVNSVPGLEVVRSITSRGTAEVNLFFSWDVDMFQTLELVNSSLAQLQSSLPPTAQVTTNRLTFAAFPIMGYSLTSDTVPLTQIWELCNYELKPRLSRLIGASTVVVQGGQEPEFEIRPSPAKMLETSVTIPELLEVLRSSNMIDSPGLMERNHQLVLSLVTGQVHTADQISKIVVKTAQNGMPVRIGDIAEVNPSVMPVYTIVTANGKPAVLLNIYRQPNGNTISVAEEVHQEIENIRKELPKGINLQPFYDQSLIVNDSITSVRDAIVIGLILASLIMVLFLRDWGTSLVAGMVIPATVAVTFAALKILGQSFNLMTLGGLAAAVGLVIDDAIVVVENIVRHRDSGQTRGEAIRSALREISVPLVGSTITPIVVFLPLISIAGVTGLFFRALAVTVGMALLTSLVLALTWTPTLSHFLIRKKRSQSGGANDGEAIHGRFLRPVIRFYEQVMQKALVHPWAVAGMIVLLIGASYVCYDVIGSDLLPGMDEGGFILDYWMPAGSSLEDTNRVLTAVEKTLRETPEVESTSRRTGLQLGLSAVTEANTGDIAVKLKRDRTRSGEEVIAEVRDKVAEQEPMLQVEFVQLLQDMIGDLSNAPEPIQIKLFCQKPELLYEWGPKIADAIAEIPGIVDVFNGIDNTITGPAVVFQVNPAVAARAGFTPEEIEQQVAAILQGEPAETPVVVGDRAYNVRIRYPESARASLEAIQNTLLTSSTGGRATLGSLATLQELPGQKEINRENLLRVLAVTARLEEINLGKAMIEVKKVMDGLKVPPEIRVVYGGGYEEQQRSFNDLVFVLVLAIVLVFIVLLFEFGSFAAPLAILASALLSTSGVFFALLITQKTFNIASFMGLIMVIGIVAKNGILLLDADQRFRAEGEAPMKAMIMAGERRFRPIIMTALATVAGMIPLSLGLGAGSQMLQPLAIAVIGGVLASMILSLVVTPAVHYYITRRAAPPILIES
jgi:CzcA family heavy metal efflux pump